MDCIPMELGKFYSIWTDLQGWSSFLGRCEASKAGFICLRRVMPGDMKHCEETTWINVNHIAIFKEESEEAYLKSWQST